jgi:hypothetical protein
MKKMTLILIALFEIGRAAYAQSWEIIDLLATAIGMMRQNGKCNNGNSWISATTYPAKNSGTGLVTII